MATKPYPQKEETTNVVQEPVVAYQAGMTDCISNYVLTPYIMESLRRSEEDYKAGRTYTQEEVDKMITKWICPHTKEEINAICDEAEADDEADRLLTSDYVYTEMERLNPWLCK